MPPPLEVRFWAKVQKGAPDECWLWTGATTHGGYGVIRFGQRNVGAHRVAVALDGREVGSMDVMHTCDNPPCVNPVHLVVGTAQANALDMVAKERMSHQRNHQPNQALVGCRCGRCRNRQIVQA